ncbi:MAG: hypothetical protein QNJ55_32770 [Xenococcus sp. MO_188.B8]|nr:hypothetical protein [Xenococcus sp. MO_188.B8]
MPLNLLIFRNLGIVSNNSYGLIIIFLLAIAIALFLLLLVNYWLWHKAKRLKPIAIILEKVEDFNHLIETLQTLTALSYFNDRENLLPKSAASSLEIKEILLTTRNSLVQSMKIHNTIYRKTGHHKDIYQLFANLENKLVHFLSLPHNNSNKEYQQILSEIINLGLTVHQEVKLARREASAKAYRSAYPLGRSLAQNTKLGLSPEHGAG